MRQEDAVLVLFKMREVVLRSSLSGNAGSTEESPAANRCADPRQRTADGRAKSVEAVPVDVALGSFRVDVLAVGEVEIPVVVLGVIGAVFSGSSIVSCQLQINISPFQRLGGGRSSFAAESTACGAPDNTQ